MNQRKHLSAKEYLLVLLVFCVCLTGALQLPISQCPDEPGRRLISDWIIRTGTLPIGDEPDTQLMLWEDLNAPVLTVRDDSGYNGWGFSYALRPYLSSIVGAAFERIALCFTDSPRVLLAASRMCSVLSVTFCCFFCLRLGHRLFNKQGAAALFAALVCFLPQVQFLGMYQNNDSLSLCAVSMVLYYLIEGFDLGWPVRSCVGLGLSFSLGLLSYYSVYGWLLMGAVFCFLAVLTDPCLPNKGKLLSVRSGLVLGICVLLAGWFFVRNAFLHHGDFLGIVSEKISRAHMQEKGYVLYKYICYRDEGMSITQFLRFRDYEWLRMTIESFIGVFGYMLVYLPKIQYRIYYTVFCGAIILFFVILLHQKAVRRDKLLMLMMLFSSIITVFLHFWQSYARDYQPQGRYVITLILPLAYMLAYSLDKTDAAVPITLPGKRVALHPAAVLTLVWLVLFAWAALGTMVKMLP